MESKAAKDEKPTSLEGSPKIIYITDEVRAQKIAKCPYCGQEVAIDAKRCEHCSRLLDFSPIPGEKGPVDRAVNFDSLGYIKSALAAKYEVIEEVAKTDTSTVFRAISMQLRREVALKVLLKNIAQDHDFTDRFHRRSRAVDKLSQNNIITIYDEGVENGLHYMAMEFLKGIDLQRKVGEYGPVSAEELISILMPAISALGHAHSNGILHGNIKCSSIFIHDDGRIILFGFGIPHLTKGNQLSFKRNRNFIEYLSPEEASDKNVDGRSDIYSLGVVMYYALTGRFPFSALNTAATLDAIINGKYEPISKLSQVPQWLEQIVDRCLQKDISKRVQSCAELLGRLNVKPAASPVQASRAEQTVKDKEKPEISEEKVIEVQPTVTEPPTSAIEDAPTSPEAEIEGAGVSTEDQPPLFEMPIEDEMLVERQLANSASDEKPLLQTPKREEVAPEPKAEIAVPVKENREVEEKGNAKSKSHVLVWVAAIVVVGVLGVGITFMMMNKGSNLKGSTSPNVERSQAETPSAQGNQPIGNQESVSTEAQPGGESVSQPETPAAQEQGVVPSTENSNPASLSGSPIEKSKVGSEKETTVSSKSKSGTTAEGKTDKTQAAPIVALVTVPDLTGTQLNVAKSILSLNGLTIGAVSTITDPANDGMVVRQVPKPGSQLKRGSTVNLIMGSK
jgi:serine/threonine protein kinase